jgi:hypothetical protein
MKELTKKQITEGNDIIDNFIDENKYEFSEKNDYHSDYNSIMPVWEKVLKLNITTYKGQQIDYNCGIYNNCVFIDLCEIFADSIFITNYSLSEYTLNAALFLTIVDFIKWYNQNKEFLK